MNLPFKNRLKQIKLFSYLNGLIKSKKLEYELSNLKKKYNNKTAYQEYTSENILKFVKRNLSSRKLIYKKNTTPNILYAGTNEFQDRSGIIQALEKIGNTNLIFRNGKYGLLSFPINEKNIIYDFETVKFNSEILLKNVKKLRNENKINILIGQFWANYILADVLQKIRNMGIIVINISMDDMLPEHWKKINGISLGAIGLASSVDLTLSTTKECCEWYFRDGHPSIYWPLASDPEIFAASKNKKKDIDVIFVGSCYGKRKSLVEYLAKNNVNIKAYGNGWPNGSIPPEKISELFNRSKIILGSGKVGHSNKIMTIKMRDFDAPMTGSAYLTDYNPALLEFYKPNKEIKLFSTKEECLYIIKHLLMNEEECIKIGKQAQLRCLRDHTWSNRFNSIINIINDII